MFVERAEDGPGGRDDCWGARDFFDGESDNDSKPSLANVEMLVDKNNFIYYVTKT